MSRVEKVSVFEFSDHVRVALQLTYLLDTLRPRPECTLYLRSDCREFMSPESRTVGAVKYLNKYAMALRFWFETTVLRRKALVSTGPESAGRVIQRTFARFLRVMRSRISVFVIVRDLKPERGEFLLSAALYSRRSVLAVESDALRRACSSVGYSPATYLYPTPITARATPGMLPVPDPPSKDGCLTVLVTGSLDAKRRNYDPLIQALRLLRARGVRARVVIGGHCLSPGARELCEQIRRECAELVAAPLLSDPELDKALVQADAILCLNRPEYYGGIKGSGAIGDAFFAGTSLLIDAALVAPDAADARFCTPFTSVDVLAEHLCRAAENRGALRVPAALLQEQAAMFATELSRWLRS